MNRRVTIVISLLLILMAIGPAAAQTDNCQLIQLASVDMSLSPGGSVTVPVTIEGKLGVMVVDTGGMYSELDGSIAGSLRMPIYKSRDGVQMAGGFASNLFATPNAFQLGELTLSNNAFFLLPPDTLGSSAVIGLIGPGFLGRYDVDFDFAHGKFNVFSRAHCPGRVVYWARGEERVAVVPFEFDDAGHIRINILLDGKSVPAMVDTGAESTTITTRMADKYLDIDDHDPKLKSLGSLSLNSAAPTEYFRYPFATLTFDGIAVQNPDIEVVRDDGLKEAVGTVVLGASVLRQLHMFVSYSEQKLYLTGAEVTAPQAAATSKP
jgi:predicted aspartyl protease